MSKASTSNHNNKSHVHKSKTLYERQKEYRKRKTKQGFCIEGGCWKAKLKKNLRCLNHVRKHIKNCHEYYYKNKKKPKKKTKSEKRIRKNIKWLELRYPKGLRR